MAVTEAADYLVTFREGYYYKDAFLKRTQPFLSSGEDSSYKENEAFGKRSRYCTVNS